MIARKENKEYTINEHQKALYLKDGYDIYDDNGKIVEYSPKKTITYNEHVKVVAELKAQIEELKSKVGVETAEKTAVIPEKAPAEPSYAELKEKATALGLEFNGNIKKEDLKALIEEAEKTASPDPEGDE